MTMKTISIQQPWAWLIVNGYKDVENRTWKSNYRGIILIHASKKIDKKGYKWVQENFKSLGIDILKLPRLEEFTLGAIIGHVCINNCTGESNSPWFFGPYAFILEHPKPLLNPYPAVGKLRIFDCNVEIDLL